MFAQQKNGSGFLHIYVYINIAYMFIWNNKENNYLTKISHEFEKEWRKLSGRHWRKRENKKKEKVNAKDHQGDWKEEIKGVKLCNYFFLNKIMYNKNKNITTKLDKASQQKERLPKESMGIRDTLIQTHRSPIKLLIWNQRT